MAETNTRPLSPHLTIWRWGPGMTVSILHRITGGALSIAGLAVLTWWLVALADGPEAYANFVGLAQLFSGVRHLVMDSGAGLELNTNKRYAVLTIIASVLLTAVLWAYLLGVLK